MSDFEYDDAAARKSHARSSRKAFESEDDYFESNPKRIAKPTKRASQLAESDAESTVARNKKKAPSKSAAGKRHCDSDDESVPRRKSKEVKPKESKETKRKAPPPSKSKRSNWRVFDSDSEEESATRAPQQLRSSYTKRVADGVVRRSAQLEGGLFLDLKLYQVDDIKNVHPRKRHEKAVLALRFQADPDSPELTALQQLLHRCKSRFVEEGYFFPDKLD